MHVATSHLAVPFLGDDTGTGDPTGPLTWGQAEIWRTMRRTGRTMNIGGTVALAPGATVTQLAATLGALVGRHQALRTRFDLTADPPRQTVSTAGTVTLEIVASRAGDAEADAETLRRRYELTPFDPAAEFPVRWGVVTTGDTPSHLVVQYSHLAVDGFGIEAIVRDLPLLGSGAPPAAAVQPLQLARRQAQPAERRHSAKSLRHWQATLRDLPAERFGVSDDPRTPRFWELVCRSPALHLALQVVAARGAVETGHVLLAAYGVALARVTGRRPSVAQVLVSNRFRPGFADAVCHLTQPGICVIDPDGDLDTVAKRVWRAATTAYLHGYFDPADHRAMLDRLAAERGVPIDISCFVNDRRGAAAALPAVPPTAEQVRAARPRTTLRWDRTLPTYDGTFYLQVDAVGGPEPAVELAIWADTHRLSPAQVEACARGIEAAAVDAALTAGG
ncbi:condensation protein [Dactylosporangium aurantiacum]|uniref:Condensation protein n=1 Tax=Dactylosporangium aurantiacum TaxID=35754 RepID=A0A9Q9IIY2_9ACTN|nr:condensation domain-containing protein [Dactylosporangium aurantiacum]MDG6105670.1 condensation domain-containing protein [Dactylosporangium aurantiacum]UWZ56999.1 condensation protein [Dactylosporangium aurantiacum]